MAMVDVKPPVVFACVLGWLAAYGANAALRCQQGVVLVKAYAKCLKKVTIQGLSQAVFCVPFASSSVAAKLADRVTNFFVASGVPTKAFNRMNQSTINASLFGFVGAVMAIATTATESFWEVDCGLLGFAASAFASCFVVSSHTPIPSF
jgi:hypothetical protein